MSRMLIGCVHVPELEPPNTLAYQVISCSEKTGHESVEYRRHERLCPRCTVQYYNSNTSPLFAVTGLWTDLNLPMENMRSSCEGIHQAKDVQLGVWDQTVAKFLNLSRRRKSTEKVMGKLER